MKPIPTHMLRNCIESYRYDPYSQLLRCKQGSYCGCHSVSVSPSIERNSCSSSNVVMIRLTFRNYDHCIGSSVCCVHNSLWYIMCTSCFKLDIVYCLLRNLNWEQNVMNIYERHVNYVYQYLPIFALISITNRLTNGF